MKYLEYMYFLPVATVLCMHTVTVPRDNWSWHSDSKTAFQYEIIKSIMGYFAEVVSFDMWGILCSTCVCLRWGRI